MPILWLASYPRSGNTWLRVFLSNLAAGDAGADINHLSVGRGGADRRAFDEILTIESSDMTHDEVERLRPAVYRLMARQASEPLFVKVHDAYGFTAEANGALPNNAGRHASRGRSPFCKCCRSRLPPPDCRFLLSTPAPTLDPS